jgi:hypothetical protein
MKPNSRNAANNLKVFIVGGGMSQNEANPIIEGLVNSAGQLKLAQLEELISRLQELRQQRLVRRLPGDESELVDKVNNWLPADIQERLSPLITKRDAGTLPPQEQNELTVLLEKAKDAHTKRVEVLTELAAIRGTSLTALMNDLGVRFPDYI